MSYDVYVDTPPAISTHSFNYTYNCAPMFYDVIPGGINALNGQTSREV